MKLLQVLFQLKEYLYPIIHSKPIKNLNLIKDLIQQFQFPLHQQEHLLIYQFVYAVNKSPNTIGIKTTLNSDEVYFRVNGDNIDDYYFQKNYDNVIATVSKINSVVSISSAHGLSEGDLITLNVKPNLSVGIGTSTAIRVNRNSNTENIQVNPIGFSSSSVNTDRCRLLIITDHGFDTGDKVYYDADTVITGVQTGSYYVHKHKR